MDGARITIIPGARIIHVDSESFQILEDLQGPDDFLCPVVPFYCHQQFVGGILTTIRRSSSSRISGQHEQHRLVVLGSSFFFLLQLFCFYLLFVGTYDSLFG